MEDLMVQNILESMTDSLMVIGRQGMIVYANKATEGILGCDRKTLSRHGLGLTFFMTDDNYEFNQIIVDAIQERAVKTYSEVPYLHPDGSLKRLAVTTSYVVDSARSPDSFVGFMVICKDITEVFQLREREKRLLEERQRLTDEKAQSLHKLAAGVAHEIRNPVVTVGGFATRLLKLERAPEPVTDYARKILDGAKKLELIVEEVEAYCDITHADFLEVDVWEVVNTSLAELAAFARSKDVVLDLRDETAGVRSCACDPVLVGKAVRHLVQNAIDFSPQGGLVHAVLSGNRETVIIEITDFGAGITPRDLDYVFNPFFSTVPDKSGMGLAVAQRIVNEHMGTLTIESAGESGTRVRVCLPRYRQHSFRLSHDHTDCES